ncbi:hypothetical protein RND71_039732 [Anisodus tanguticus]|uniref:Uncharacterized protein n=1 Tax=Anisodus tanguticus TaxID=243964 RepID=A0AAE1UVL7_9SOLA|nr:hypothetical protein RND71_039732 [Anisodus tanguticus]
MPKSVRIAHDLSVHNSKDCNRDHETIARHRKAMPEQHDLSVHNSKDCNRYHETIARHRKAMPEPVKTTGKMITFVNGIQKKLLALTFRSFLQLRYQSIEKAGKDCISDGHELSAHNSKDCNRDHKTIARHRKDVPEPVKITGKMITSVNGIQKKLPPLTFRKFLQLRYQSIEKAGKDCIADGNIHLETVKADKTNVLSAHNSKDCNPDHETIARYRKVAPEPVKTTGNMITSVNGIQKNLPHLTFGSFLP